MNKVIVIFLSIFSVLQVSCGLENGPLVTIDARVFDEHGQPVEDAEVTGGFSVRESVSAYTDESGAATVRGNNAFGVRLIVEKEGSYDSRIDRIYTADGDISEFAPRTRSVDLKIREKRNPIPLIARRKEFEIPVKGEWVGFDFELSDWVAPHGEGQGSDVLVRYTNEFLGYNIDDEGLDKVRAREARTGKDWTEEKAKFFYGNWSGELELKFEADGEGIIKVVEDYIPESAMSMPHLATTNGYQATAAWAVVSPPEHLDSNVGYFLRLRVVKDGDQIVQANYAKINEEVAFDPRGRVKFSYCFNPEVNDRNLEFDPTQNLLQGVWGGERVQHP